MSGPDRIFVANDVSCNDESLKPIIAAREPDWCFSTEYVRRDRDALAALPEVQAMIADAVAKEREACAQVGYVTCAETRHVKLGDAVSKAILARAEWITVTVPQDIGDTLDDLLDFAWNCDASKRGEG